MEFRRIEEYKPEFAVDDFLTIAQKTKNTSLLYVDEVLGDGLLNSKHEANLVKQHLEKSMNDIFCAMVDNVNMKDAQPNDIYDALETLDAVDEQLKTKVKDKQIELNQLMDKVVTERAQKPKDWAGITKEACQLQSKSTEQFTVNLGETIKEEDTVSSIESSAKEYRDSVKLLADLNKDMPSKQNKIDRVQTLFEALDISK